MSAKIIQFARPNARSNTVSRRNVRHHIALKERPKPEREVVQCVVDGNTYEVTFDRGQVDEVVVIIRRMLHGRPNAYKRRLDYPPEAVIDAARAQLSADPSDATVKAAALRDEQEQYRRKAAEHIKKAEEYNRRADALG